MYVYGIPTSCQSEMPGQKILTSQGPEQVKMLPYVRIACHTGSGTVTQGSNPVAPEPAQVALQVFELERLPRADTRGHGHHHRLLSRRLYRNLWRSWHGPGAIRGCGIPAPSSVSTHLITRILKLVVRTRSCTGHGYRCRRWRGCWRRSGYLRFKLHPCVHPSRHCDLQQLP